IAARP
ncbi:hypothetical protein ECFDA506_0166, partial [Escherichia coli FDA506]